MGSRISLADVLSDFGPTMNSVSVRTAAYRVGTTWHNLVSVVDFSELDPVSLGGSICDKWNALGQIAHDRLCFRYSVFSYDCRTRLFDTLKTGLLPIDDIDVSLSKFDVLPALGNINFYSPLEWPQFQLQANASPQDINHEVLQHIRSANHDAGLQRYLSTVPYDSLSEAIAFYMELMNDGLRSYDGEIIVRVPIFAKINGARCDSAGSPVTVTYQADPKLGEQLFLSCTLFSANNSARERLKMTGSVRLSDSLFESTTKPIMVENNPRLEAVLVHRSAGNICGTGWMIHHLIPRRNTNPLWSLFQRFCSPEKFRDLLATPGSERDTGNRPQRLFESRIAWLLGAYGFITVVLGPQECLRDPGTNVERGSLDLLAFHETKRVLILGSCKINAPKESDYDNLANVRALLLTNLVDPDSFETHMVIFTAAAETRRSKELDTSGSPIPRVVHNFDLKRLTEGIVSLGNNENEWIFEELSQGYGLSTFG